MIFVHFHGKPFNITVIQAYAPTNNAEEAEVEQFYEDLQDLLELTPPPQKKRSCSKPPLNAECIQSTLENIKILWVSYFFIEQLCEY